jgi:hypothetical protein
VISRMEPKAECVIIETLISNGVQEAENEQFQDGQQNNALVP